MKKIFLLLFLLPFCFSCSSDSDSNNNEMYFPPNNSDVWETETVQSLNWNENNLQELYDYLILKTLKVLLYFTMERL